MKKTLAIVLFLIVACWCLPQVSTADQVYFYHNDPAGTPLAMTDASGAVVWKADYKPFGEEHSTSGAAANDRRFVGKEKDEETGLSYFGARYEDAKTGRFIAPDSVRAVDANSNKTNEKMLLDPQRLNTYAYGLNNPYRFIDPDGNIPIDTLWDAANIIYDLFTGDRLSLAADSAALLIPYVPAGLTKISKAVTRIDPTKVRFSQSSIKSTFKDGKSIEDLAEGLRLGRI
ncbi:MAG TPA: RHS repeat-associated core domain-containing protein, partial [Bellilinea sp.]|nr:RHS repeat-associated core domain-containing protein [Bellilinea sp.]